MDTVAGRRLRPSPKQLKKLLLWVGFAVVLFLLLMVGSHRLLTQADRKTEMSWQQIRRLVQRQLDLVSELTPLVANAPPEFTKPLRLLKETHQALQQQHGALARSVSVTPDQLRDYEKAQEAMAASVERVLRTGPGVVGSAGRLSHEWVGCYRGTQKLLRAEKERYNVSASAYNRLYGTFFMNWVAEKFHMQGRPLFRKL